MLNNFMNTQLLTRRWFEIPQRALQHPDKIKLATDLKEKNIIILQ